MATIGNMMTPGMTGATNPNDPALTGPANPTAGMGPGGATSQGVDEELQMLGLEGGPMQQYAMISGIMQQTEQQMQQMNSMFSQNEAAINGSMAVGGSNGGTGAGALGGGGGLAGLSGGGTGANALGGGGGLAGLNGVTGMGGTGVAQGLGNYLGTPMVTGANGATNNPLTGMAA